MKYSRYFRMYGNFYLLGLKKICLNSLMVAFLVSLLLSSCGGDSKQSSVTKRPFKLGDDEVRIKGSESELPLALKLVDYFKANGDTNIKFNVSGGGSNIGISLLETDKIDMAMSSRKLKDTEIKYLADKGIEVVEMVVAYDALFIIVNKNNPIEKLTTEQLQSIYSGKVNNWKELGILDLPIIKCSRRASSGTKSFFESIALNGQKADPKIREFDNYSSLLELVKKEKGAIGFNSLGYSDEDVKYVQISMDGGKTYFDVKDKSKLSKENYPLVRPLYLFYPKSATWKFGPFVKFLESDTAKALIRKAGFIL